MRQAQKNPCLASLIDQLDRSIDLIAVVPEHLYGNAESGKGSIGAHIRHNLDLVNAFLRGVRIGSIDYSDRERDPRTEKDQRYAAWKIKAAIGSLTACARVDPGTLLVVRSEVHPKIRHRSSFSREVEFVHSHMVHHHALIKERLSGYAITLPTGLGVAPSTQTYRDSLKLAA